MIDQTGRRFFPASVNEKFRPVFQDPVFGSIDILLTLAVFLEISIFKQFSVQADRIDHQPCTFLPLLAPSSADTDPDPSRAIRDKRCGILGPLLLQRLLRIDGQHKFGIFAIPACVVDICILLFFPPQNDPVGNGIDIHPEKGVAIFFRDSVLRRETQRKRQKQNNRKNPLISD